MLFFTECLQVDLTIALDSSGSVRAAGWQKLLQFTERLVSRLVLSPDCAQVALVSFGNTAYVESTLTSDPDAIYDVIPNMRFRDEWTNTAAVFKVMTEDIYWESNGARAEATKFCILVTDGPSNRDETNTIPYANVS